MIFEKSLIFFKKILQNTKKAQSRAIISPSLRFVFCPRATLYVKYSTKKEFVNISHYLNFDLSESLNKQTASEFTPTQAQFNV